MPRQNLDQFSDEIDGLKNKPILVSGAGGSIGSEICRTLIKGGLKRIILIDISESALFTISQELKDISKDVEIHSVLLSVKNKNKLNEIFKKYNPEIVYHAAAYKHVPLLEDNDNYSQAFKNNFFGTCNMADGINKFWRIKIYSCFNGQSCKANKLDGCFKKNGRNIFRFIGARFKNSILFSEIW